MRSNRPPCFFSSDRSVTVEGRRSCAAQNGEPTSELMVSWKVEVFAPSSAKPKARFSHSTHVRNVIGSRRSPPDRFPKLHPQAESGASAEHSLEATRRKKSLSEVERKVYERHGPVSGSGECRVFVGKSSIATHCSVRQHGTYDLSAGYCVLENARRYRCPIGTPSSVAKFTSKSQIALGRKRFPGVPPSRFPDGEIGISLGKNDLGSCEFDRNQWTFPGYIRTQDSQHSLESGIAFGSAFKFCEPVLLSRSVCAGYPRCTRAPGSRVGKTRGVAFWGARCAGKYTLTAAYGRRGVE